MSKTTDRRRESCCTLRIGGSPMDPMDARRLGSSGLLAAGEVTGAETGRSVASVAQPIVGPYLRGPELDCMLRADSSGVS